MKANLHPTWYPEAKITCACGNSFVVGAGVPELRVEVCYNCHPFYTGQMKFVDRAGRVDAFRIRQAATDTKRLSKTEKRRLKKAKQLEEEAKLPETLSELRSEK